MNLPAIAPRVHRVLHVVPGWAPVSPGGTERYACDLATAQSTLRAVAVHARRSAPGRPLGEAQEAQVGGLLLREVVNDFTARSPWTRNAFDIPELRRDLAAFATRFRPDLVHVHHLAGHGISVLAVLRRLGLPLVYQVQDWWALCARANFCDAARRRCPGPTPGRCASCLPLTGVFPGALWSRLLHRLRQMLLRRALRLPDALVLGSQAIARDYRRAGLLPKPERVYILSYGVGTVGRSTTPQPARRLGTPLRCGCIATMLPHKGLHVAVGAFRDLPPASATLDLWGHDDADPAYTAELRALAAGTGVTIRGPFASGELPAILADLDLLIVPSIGLESFSLAAHEAMAAGVPVLASADGVFVDLFADGAAEGTLFPPGDSVALRACLQRFLDDPKTLARNRAALPPVLSMAEHQPEIERVYDTVMSARSPRPAGSGRPGGL